MKLEKTDLYGTESYIFLSVNSSNGKIKSVRMDTETDFDDAIYMIASFLSNVISAYGLTTNYVEGALFNKVEQLLNGMIKEVDIEKGNKDEVS